MKKVYTFSNVLYASENISLLCVKENQNSAAKTSVLQEKKVKRSSPLVVKLRHISLTGTGR